MMAGCWLSATLSGEPFLTHKDPAIGVGLVRSKRYSLLNATAVGQRDTPVFATQL